MYHSILCLGQLFTLYFLVPQGSPGTYLGQGPYFFLEKQLNVQNKTLFIKKGTIAETVTVTKIQQMFRYNVREF